MAEFQYTAYLGDAVYAGYDGFQVWLWTSDGVNDSDKIAIEPNVMEQLDAFYRRCARREG